MLVNESQTGRGPGRMYDAKWCEPKSQAT